MASLALYKHGGNIYRAAEDLLNNNGIIDTESSGLSSEEGINCQNFFFFNISGIYTKQRFFEGVSTNSY